MINQKKIYIGCGEDSRDGYVGCDIRSSKNVGIVCAAWDISKHMENVEDIYSRHLLEHLTLNQVKYTLNDWYKALDYQGSVNIVVPNLSFHVDQLLNSKIDEFHYSRYNLLDFRWGIAGLFGWQSEQYVGNNLPTKYWDVHKIGFTRSFLKNLLEETGFTNVTVDVVDDYHLHALGWKLSNNETVDAAIIKEIKDNIKKEATKHNTYADIKKKLKEIGDLKSAITIYVTKDGSEMKLLNQDNNVIDSDIWHLSGTVTAPIKDVFFEECMWNYYTYGEFIMMLRELRRVLVENGKISFSVFDLEQQLLELKSSENDSDGNNAFLKVIEQIYGNSEGREDLTTFAKVRKSGYTSNMIEFFCQREKYTVQSIEKRDGKLFVVASYC